MSDPYQPVPLTCSYLQRAIIADMGRMGYDFFEAIHHFVKKIQTEVLAVSKEEQAHNNHNLWAVKRIYDTCLNSVVRWFGLHPSEAIECIKSLPPTHELNDEMWLLDHGSYAELNLICQDHCTGIYLWLRQQYPYQENLAYIPVVVGYDHVVMQECRISEVRSKVVWAPSVDVQLPYYDLSKLLHPPESVDTGAVGEMGYGFSQRRPTNQIFVDDRDQEVSVTLQSNEVLIIGDDGKLYVKRQDPREL